MSEFEYMNNANGYGGSFWKKTHILGKSWLHDKTNRELLGYIEKTPDSDVSKLFQVNEYWDEDIEEVVEDNSLIKEFSTEDEAVKYGKKYFFGEK